MDELTGPIQSWMAGGRFSQVDGVELFYHLSKRHSSHLPWLVCFHGFPTSSWDWHLLLPHLEKKYRVLVFDFPGYGLSAKHPVDVVEPDALPYAKYGGAIDIDAYKEMLHGLLQLDWQFLDGGHFSIGTRDTVNEFLSYITDVEAAVSKAINQTGGFFQYIDRSIPPVAWSANRNRDIIEAAKKDLFPRYGHLPTFPYVVAGHIEMVNKRHVHHGE